MTYPDRSFYYKQNEGSDQVPSSVHHDEAPKKKFDRKKAPYYALGGVILIFLVFVGLGLAGKGPLQFSKGKVLGAKTGDVQAVFLANGQVYFGQLKDANEQYLTLTTIFYLKAKDDKSVQATDKSSPTTANTENFDLVKLGNELHGPQDMMKINRDQVLFYENLKADGKVAQAIASYQGSK